MRIAGTTLLSILVAAQTAMAQPPDVETQILDSEALLASALQTDDRSTLERLLDPAFVLRGYPDVSREIWIRNAIDLCWGQTYSLDDFSVRRDGSLAIAGFVMTFDQDPVTCQPALLRSLITDVWTLDAGEWRLLVRHSSGATTEGASSIPQQFATVPEPPPVWQVDGELSLVATSGNSETQTVGTTADVKHEQGGWSSTGRTAFVRTSARGIEQARSLLLEARPGRQLTPRLTLFGRAGFRRDRFAGIDSRIAFGTGLAFEILDTPTRQLTVEGGAGYDREKRIGAAELRFQTAQARVRLRWQLAPGVTLDEEAGSAADPGDAGNWRGANKASVSVAINSLLALKLSHALEYLNEPVPGFERLDTITSVGLVLALRR
jgi:putative salt-induced outer membrane protein YdiY